MSREGREPLADKSGESTYRSRSEGEKGLRWSGAGNFGDPLEWDRYVTALLRSPQGCQVQFRTSRRNVGILWRCSSGQGPHIAMTSETRGFSRDVAGFSSYDGEFRLPLVLAQQVQSSIQLVRESCGLLSSHFRAKSPHLGLGPGRNVPLQGQQGYRGRIPWLSD